MEPTTTATTAIRSYSFDAWTLLHSVVKGALVRLEEAKVVMVEVEDIHVEDMEVEDMEVEEPPTTADPRRHVVALLELLVETGVPRYRAALSSVMVVDPMMTTTSTTTASSTTTTTTTRPLEDPAMADANAAASVYALVRLLVYVWKACFVVLVGSSGEVEEQGESEDLEEGENGHDNASHSLARRVARIVHSFDSLCPSMVALLVDRPTASCGATTSAPLPTATATPTTTVPLYLARKCLEWWVVRAQIPVRSRYIGWHELVQNPRIAPPALFQLADTLPTATGQPDPFHFVEPPTSMMTTATNTATTMVGSLEMLKQSLFLVLSTPMATATMVHGDLAQPVDSSLLRQPVDSLLQQRDFLEHVFRFCSSRDVDLVRLWGYLQRLRRLRLRRAQPPATTTTQHAALDPRSLLRTFLKVATGYDESLVLEYLISEETISVRGIPGGFLGVFMEALRTCEHLDWTRHDHDHDHHLDPSLHHTYQRPDLSDDGDVDVDVDVGGAGGGGTDNSDNSEDSADDDYRFLACISNLVRKVRSLQRHNLFPYNASPLIQRLATLESRLQQCFI